MGCAGSSDAAVDGHYSSAEKYKKKKEEPERFNIECYYEVRIVRHLLHGSHLSILLHEFASFKLNSILTERIPLAYLSGCEDAGGRWERRDMALHRQCVEKAACREIHKATDPRHHSPDA